MIGRIVKQKVASRPRVYGRSLQLLQDWFRTSLRQLQASCIDTERGKPEIDTLTPIGKSESAALFSDRNAQMGRTHTVCMLWSLTETSSPESAFSPQEFIEIDPLHLVPDDS